MDSTPNIAKIGALLGDTARARMLSALMHGKALTASELATEAGITAQTATTHLSQLQAGGLLSMRKQGRHKYFTLASEEVATLLESMMALTTGHAPLRTRTGPRDEQLRQARVCYNHLAGYRGIQLYDHLIASGKIVEQDGALLLSKKGERFAAKLDIAIDTLRTSRSPLCRACLDWSERRTHLAGSLGRALFETFERKRWLKRVPDSRVVLFSASGEREFDRICAGR
jgi:DNA-binding transcriptional ArsR family regulator